MFQHIRFPMTTSERITDILAKKDFMISVEVFPPRNGKSPDIILGKIEQLENLGLDFISITKGAMGSMRGGTIPIGYMISDRYGLNSLVHFRCRDLTKRDVENLLVDHSYFGIKNILAILGDPIAGETAHTLNPEVHNLYASELVGQINRMNWGQYLPLIGKTGSREGIKSDFCIGVAAYPEAKDMEKEMMVMEEKVRAGADFAITQMIFDADVYSDYIEKLRGRGIDIPVIPGIRPVTKPEHVRAAEDIFGANVPDDLKDGMKGLSPADARQFCIGFSINLCKEMKKVGAPGVHLFTLNDVSVVAEIVQEL